MTTDIKKLRKKDLNKSFELISSYDNFELDLPNLDELWVYFKNALSFGYFINENLVGLVICEITLNKQAYIWYLIVDEKYRGRGIGQKLILELEEKLKSKKIKKIFLNSSEDSKKFYEKLDFMLGDDVTEMINYI
jgi:ribosomal protein S18 acetylase RimI-like enzyme